MRVNTQESLTQSDEAGNVQNPVWGQVMQLDTVGVQQATHERMQWKSKPVGGKGLQAYPLVWCRGRDWFIPWQACFTFHHNAVSNQRSQISGIKR